MKNIHVNPLPVPTWRWLKVNDRLVDNLPVLNGGIPNVRIQSDPAVTITKAPAAFHAKGGMGNEMDQLITESASENIAIRNDKCIKNVNIFTFDYLDADHSAKSLSFTAEENSKMTAVIHQNAARGTAGTAALKTEIIAHKNAFLRLIHVQTLGNQFVSLDDTSVHLEEGAQVELIHIVLGGKKMYKGIGANLQGDTSKLSVQLGYLREKGSSFDVNYVAEHYGKRSESFMKADGVLCDDAFKCFRGTIDFKQGARDAKGEETEDVLLLGDTMINQTVPLILCGEENVEGSHGATIGKLSDDLLFYMASRGIDAKTASDLLAKARIEALCQLVPDADVQNAIRAYMEEVA